jgi:hypothetical protein
MTIKVFTEQFIPKQNMKPTKQNTTKGSIEYYSKRQRVISVFSPTDVQLESLKNNFKFALKFTLKGPNVGGLKSPRPRPRP